MYRLTKFGEVVRPKKLENVSNSVGIVILARLSSTRLPGKALKEIAGKKVLTHILNRLQKVVPSGQILLACSTETSDDALEQFAAEQGIGCYRGSLSRVGERFYEAAQSLNCQYAARINGDNLFLDPTVLQQMVLKAQTGTYRFLSNVQGRTFPKGMSVEIVDVEYYGRKLDQIKQDAYCNEHVMVCLYQEPKPEDHYYLKNEILPEAAGIQLALDTPEDFARSKFMLEQMPSEQYDLKTTFKYYQKYEAEF